MLNRIEQIEINDPVMKCDKIISEEIIKELIREEVQEIRKQINQLKKEFFMLRQTINFIENL